jgi:cytochrome c-type biogenesis protein CcmH/NrfG
MPPVAVPDTLRERGAVLLRDHLSEVARKERRALLAASTAGYIVVKTGLVPSKIEALGITFSGTEQGALLAVFGLVVAYFTVSFVLYAATDALALAWDI